MPIRRGAASAAAAAAASAATGELGPSSPASSAAGAGDELETAAGLGARSLPPHSGPAGPAAAAEPVPPPAAAAGAWPATESLTRGCFIMPAAPQIAGSAAVPHAQQPYTLPPLFANEPLHRRKARAAAYRSCRNWQQKEIEKILSDSNHSVFSDVAGFCEQTLPAHSTSADVPAVGYGEVPTALLLTGINTPDHDPVFASLVARLKQITPHCVLLRSRECKGLAGVMKSVVQKLLGLQASGGDDEETADEATRLKLARLPNYDFQVLRGWYEHHYPKSANGVTGSSTGLPSSSSDRPPAKKRAADKTGPAAMQQPPLIVILQDFEAFEPAVLADFVTACSNHRDTLPIFLVFGIASTPDVLHRNLPRSAITLLNTRRFRLQNSTKALEIITQRVLMSTDCAFKIGPLTLGQLLDDFLFHSLSVFHVAKGLNLAALRFFMHSPLSFLNDMEQFQSPQSTSLLDAGASALAESFAGMSAGASAESITHALAAARCSDQLSAALALCLHSLAITLPEDVDGYISRNLTSWLIECMRRPLAAMPAWGRMKELLKVVATDTSLGLLQKCVEILSARADIQHAGTGEAREKLTALAGELVALQASSAAAHLQAMSASQTPVDVTAELVAATAQPASSAAGPVTEEDVDAVLSGTAGNDSSANKTSAARRRGNLRSQLMSINTGDAVAAVRNKLVAGLETVLAKLSQPMNSIAHHQLLYWNENLVDLLHGRARLEVQHALAEPRKALNVTAASNEAEETALPDIAIAYQLHLECGKLINLHDWLQAFASVVELVPPKAEDESGEAADNSSKTPKTAAAREPSLLTQARFARAVAELQFLGFVKPSTRKADHVARLTWTR